MDKLVSSQMVGPGGLQRLKEELIAQPQMSAMGMVGFLANQAVKSG